MDSVKVDKAKLLEIVRENRNKHRKIFEEALEGYRKQAIAELDSMLADAKAGRRIRRSVSLIEPTDQTSDYDRVIRMLEMSVDEFVVLQEHEFAQYVLDRWNWRKQFLMSSSNYSHTAKVMNDTENL